MQIFGQYKRLFDAAFNELNEKQRVAVEAIEGPVLVLAGPGTGKTQILAVRIGKILLETDSMPDNILCLTYTEAGTIAMRKRLTQFIGPDAHRVNIYTFHAFCNDVIQANMDYFGKRELEPVSELENVNLIESILEELPLQHSLKKLKGDQSYAVSRLNNLFRMMKEEDWDEIKMSNAIDDYMSDLPNRDEYIYKRGNSKTGVKVGDIKWKDVEAEKDKMDKLRDAANLFPLYTSRMREMGRYDYSDMILWVVKAFKDGSTQGENMLRNYQERYLYFLVDEFQDTNGAQNELLNLLISYWDTPNVFAVGDDDQSIYEFQGARVKNIMDFYYSYQQEIKVVVLTENYRSHQGILDSAKVVIEHNQERLINKLEGLTKNLSAANPERKTITEPKIHEYENTAHEQAGILQQIEKLKDDGVPLEEIAVIYFKHAQSEGLITAIEKRGIPYQVRKRINILDLSLTRHIISIFHYLSEESRYPHSAEDLLFEIMHYKFFDIHPHDIAAIAAWISGKRDEKINWRAVIGDPGLLANIKLRDHESILNFEKKLTHWIQETHNLTLQILFEKILNESGLLKYILIGEQRVWNLEVVTTLFEHIKSEGLRKPRISIREYLETLEQMEIHGLKLEIQKTISNAGGVNFITAHGAKGLEFEYVFLMGCTADKWEKSKGDSRKYSLPDTLTFTDENNKTESQRRLFYVAMTRAKQHLMVSFATHNADGKEIEPSQFVTELTSGTGNRPEKQNIDIETLVRYKITELSEAPAVVIELFDKEYISKRVENFVLSASALNAYIYCPVKFYFEKIVKVPVAKNDSMAFGTSIHFALRRLFERMKESEPNYFPPLEIFINDFIYELRRNEDSFTEKQFQNRVDLGNQLLTDYYNANIQSFNRVVVTEYPVRNAMMDNVPITGVFDKIEFYGKEVNVVDYKTGSVTYAMQKLLPPNDKNPDGGDYWRQIMFYKILLDAQKYKPWKMISGEVDFLEKNEKNEFVKYRFEVVDSEVEIVKAQIKDSYQKIMNLEFTQGCGRDECEWCTFVRDNLNSGVN
ncbi:MAG: ATP-dependent helicase [Chitinophagales bacterium]